MNGHPFSLPVEPTGCRLYPKDEQGSAGRTLATDVGSSALEELECIEPEGPSAGEIESVL
jgi:hypothetical protein